MHKSYRLIAVEKSAYIYECGNCKTRFRVPQRGETIRATCPSCSHIHVIKSERIKTSYDFGRRIKEFFVKMRTVPTWFFYVILFAAILIVQILMNLS